MIHTIVFIRHGKTSGNLEKRYIGGKSDEPLCPQGIAELLKYKDKGYYPAVDRVVSSDMQRCLQTANLLYTSQGIVSFSGLRECDFGLFEGKNYEELKDCRDYQCWLDANGTIPFPEGENPNDFRRRSQRTFLEVISCLSDGQSCAIICHGGTIMAVLDKFSSPHRDFYNWQVKNGLGYCMVFDTERRTATEITALEDGQTWNF